MTRYEKTAWVLALGSIFITYYLGSAFRLITFSDGVITAHNGLGYVCLKVILIMVVIEVAAELLNKKAAGKVECDERDEGIKLRASHIGLMFLSVMLVGGVAMLLLTQMLTIRALDITVMFALMLYLLNITWVVRHGAEIYLYRFGYDGENEHY